MLAMDKRPPAEGPARHDTVREAMHRALLDGLLTARDLSQLVGIPEHDVAGHLEHIERSLKHRGERMIIEPSTCLDCGFAFTRRRRHTRPGSCPQCRGGRISLPRFHIER